MNTKQIEFWNGTFEKEYTDRNSRDPDAWDKFYMETWGYTKQMMNEKFLNEISRDIKILEVGCNTGMQLACLQRMGFSELYGIELQQYAVEKAKEYTSGINIIQGSGFDIPFKDAYFDIVCTNGVLIHIAPPDWLKFMKEIFRCSKKYIWGFEYYAEKTESISYRGNDGFLWKADFAQVWLDNFCDLELVKKEFFPYIGHPENKDAMYLLRKK